MSNIPDSIKKEIAESINGPKHLNLSNLGLNDNDLTELQELLEKKSSTSSIDLSYNNITSQGCHILCLLTQLRTLNLSHNHIQDQSIAHLIATSIHTLDVSHNGITDVGANQLLQHLDKYTALSINGNQTISAETSKKIMAKFTQNSAPSEPIGIDLGLNVTSVLPTNFFHPVDSSFTPSTRSSADSLAERLYDEHQEEIQGLSELEKKKLLDCFCKKLGITLDPQQTKALKA